MSRLRARIQWGKALKMLRKDYLQLRISTLSLLIKFEDRLKTFSDTETSKFISHAHLVRKLLQKALQQMK